MNAGSSYPRRRLSFGSSPMGQSRLRVTGIHFALSVVVATAVGGVIGMLWFPGDFAQLMGGGRLFALIAGCDIVLGPLLALIVISPRKTPRARLFDYGVIIAVQIAALGYGVTKLVDARPALIVLGKDDLEILSAGEIVASPLAVSMGYTVAAVSMSGPTLVGLKLPTDSQERNRAMRLELSGQSLGALREFQESVDLASLVAKSQDIESLSTALPDARKIVEARIGILNWEKWGWLPVKTRFGFHVALIDRVSSSIAHYLPIEPP